MKVVHTDGVVIAGVGIMGVWNPFPPRGRHSFEDDEGVEMRCLASICPRT
jgi:hypothetical protein